MIQHVAHAAFAARQVEDQAGAPDRPAQARTVGDRRVQLLGGRDTVIDQMQDFAPERLLQPIGKKARNLRAHA